MSLKERFINFFKKEEVPEQEIEIINVTNESNSDNITTRLGTEHISDSDLRWELKKIAKIEQTTMRAIVEEIVKEYVDNYNSKTKQIKLIENNTAKPQLTSKCEFCGKEFVKTNNSHKYCSDECRKDAKRAYVYTITLPNGLKLAKYQCKEYTQLPYWGGNGNIYYGGGQLCPFSLTQLLDLKKHFDEIPKTDREERVVWFKEKYDINMKSFDRIIWNLYTGTFDHIFEAYYQKNYRIQFDKYGQTKLGA